MFSVSSLLLCMQHKCERSCKANVERCALLSVGRPTSRKRNWDRRKSVKETCSCQSWATVWYVGYVFLGISSPFPVCLSSYPLYKYIYSFIVSLWLMHVCGTVSHQLCKQRTSALDSLEVMFAMLMLCLLTFGELENIQAADESRKPSKVWKTINNLW